MILFKVQSSYNNAQIPGDSDRLCVLLQGAKVKTSLTKHINIHSDDDDDDNKENDDTDGNTSAASGKKGITVLPGYKNWNKQQIPEFWTFESFIKYL